ncbi:MAG: glycosyl transferase [Hyphomicrobiales bacterium]|nr:glycosyl transferase [Hyphomicrobiales bacterium]
MSHGSKVLFYVQHLLGVGHVFRAMRIVAGLVGSGFDVELIYGGQRLQNFQSHDAKVHFLPSLNSARGDFSQLVTADGTVADDRYRDNRRDRVLEILATCRPDIVITEAFPFGRRQMHFELLPLMDAVQSMDRKPRVFSSIRDILQEGNKPSKDWQTVELINRYFDGVLVHGDRNLVELAATFPFTAEIAKQIHYTGIVTPPRDQDTAAPQERYDVVVSAGGGLLGRELIFAAAEARKSSPFKDARWCILTGPYMAAEDRKRLEKYDMEIHQFIPDLHRVLKTAQLSISLTGYNTVADIMAAGCRAIVAPQWNKKETEQLRRAELLSKLGLVEMLAHDEKTPSALSAAIDRVMSAPPPDWSMIRQDGAAHTARILHQSLTGDQSMQVSS